MLAGYAIAPREFGVPPAFGGFGEVLVGALTQGSRPGLPSFARYAGFRSRSEETSRGSVPGVETLAKRVDRLRFRPLDKSAIVGCAATALGLFPLITRRPLLLPPGRRRHASSAGETSRGSVMTTLQMSPRRSEGTQALTHLAIGVPALQAL